MMHLQRVASLERAPNEYGGEGHCVTVRYGIKLSREGSESGTHTSILS